MWSLMDRERWTILESHHAKDLCECRNNRTTSLKTSADDWRVVELSKEWMNLDDKAATVTDKYKDCITIFTKKMVSLQN